MGLDNETYKNAFRQMQEMAHHVYNDMTTNFAEYGIKAETDKDGHFNLVSGFGDVLYQIALQGELSNNVLAANIKNIKSKVKKHKFNLIINRLQDNGFEITKNGDTLEVSYPDMPPVIAVLKSYALVLADFYATSKPSYMFYMTDLYNFINFQYRFVEDETTRPYPEPVFMTEIDLLAESGKQAMYWLYEQATRHGFTLAEGVNTKLEFKKGSKPFLLLQAEGDKIHSRIILRKVLDKHMDMIYSLPKYLQESFTNETCTFCSGNKPTDGKCTMRISYNWNGVPMQGCAYHSFKFNDIAYEDLPLILELYKIENAIA